MNTSNNDENNEFKLDNENENDNENPFNDDANPDFDFDQSDIGDKTKNVKAFFNDPIKKKYTIILSSVILVFLGFFLLTSPDDSSEEDDFFEDDQMIMEQPQTTEEDEAPLSDESLEAKDNNLKSLDENSDTEELPLQVDTQETYTSSINNNLQAPQLVHPQDGATRNYDESSHRSEFKWEGIGPATINIAKNPDMTRVSVTAEVKNNSFTSPPLMPGKWYWQVKNSSAASSIFSFTITPSPKRMISIKTPKQDGMLTSGEIISWTGDERIAYYKVILSQNGNQMYSFATSATNYKIGSIPLGTYQLKIASFSEVSGKWEYTEEISVVMQ